MNSLRIWINSLYLRSNLGLAALFSSIGYFFLGKAMKGIQNDAESIAKDIKELVNESNSRLH
jgi:hypothetical protein